ncbi:MAG: glycosyltransferase [Acidobacteriota bacterium]|nr:glycosyltransferase [Acidobacteriota bacterium]
MPTRNRRRFVGQAIWYFLRQDYPHKELIVLDDGEDGVADLIPADERIRYVRLERVLSLGAKRNLGCGLSRGELIAHWDDDDWMAAHRLRLQVAQLVEHDAHACGTRDVLYYWPDAGEAWLYRYPEQERPWLAGCTLLYRREAWAEHPFPEINVGEDSAFVRQFLPERLHAAPDPSFYVGLIHSGNTGAKNLRDPRWQRRPLDEVSRLLALDSTFYAGLSKGASHTEAMRPRPHAPVSVAANFDVFSGYGSMAEYLVLGMSRAGACVNVVPLSVDARGMSDEFQKLLRASRPFAGGPVIYFSWPRADVKRFRAAGDLFINTMWESGRLPKGWAEMMNDARAVIVPTEFGARVCRESGVTAHVEVIPEGIDPEVYHYLERPERPGLTTLTVGPINDRKHVLKGVAAWEAAFAADPEARLIIKTQYNYQNYVPDDPRISYVDTVETTRGIAHWYQKADVLLALGNEGFGLPLVEGMATGLPVIALNSEGQQDVCREARDLLLPVDPVEWRVYHNNAFGPCGLRGVPSVEDVAARLRWVARHRDEARAMGRAASEWATKHRSVWDKGPAVLDVLESRVRSPRPLRRVNTLWAPSWQGKCGIAEYTAKLARELPAARAVGQWPNLGGVRLLHIQHEFSLFDNAELTRRVREAQAGGVPVAVTEHSVTRETNAWERDADALLALTSRGAEMLRARWPAKTVQMIPCGCPTWFPARKRRRGRVIGAFGFLEQHKGFWKLLEVLRGLPGSELLLFSYAKPGAAWLEQRWSQSSAGLPVRRESGYLPDEVIARRLAAAADVLVFWYEQVEQASASSAVTVGLATGVPVLTSSTDWFQDLRDATYQPPDLTEGVQRLIEDTALREQLTAAARDYCHEHSWPKTAERHLSLWRSLEAHH